MHILVGTELKKVLSLYLIQCCTKLNRKVGISNKQ